MGISLDCCIALISIIEIIDTKSKSCLKEVSILDLLLIRNKQLFPD